jgi:hypothetical protein
MYTMKTNKIINKLLQILNYVLCGFVLKSKKLETKEAGWLRGGC